MGLVESGHSGRETLADPGASDGADVPAARVLPGTRVGRYEILAQLGEGGMGVVYVARDPELQRKVALKILRAGDASWASSVGRSRLLREAQALAKLTHPNVVAIHDVGEHEGTVWIAMELVRGPSLGIMLQRLALKKRPFSPAHVALIGERIASALDYAHRRAEVNGRRLELDWLSGDVVARGKRLGVPTPVHRALNDVLVLHAHGAPKT